MVWFTPKIYTVDGIHLCEARDKMYIKQSNERKKLSSQRTGHWSLSLKVYFTNIQVIFPIAKLNSILRNIIKCIVFTGVHPWKNKDMQAQVQSTIYLAKINIKHTKTDTKPVNAPVGFETLKLQTVCTAWSFRQIRTGRTLPGCLPATVKMSGVHCFKVCLQLHKEYHQLKQRHGVIGTVYRFLDICKDKYRAWQMKIQMRTHKQARGWKAYGCWNNNKNDSEMWPS